MAQLSLTAVAVIVGLLLVGQLRSQERPTQISTLSPQDLSTLIETLSDRNRELRSGLSDVTEQIREYQAAETQGQSAVSVSTEDLHRIRAFSGEEAVTGQGLELTVKGALDAIAVNDLLNELRNAGAEALAVDEVRVTASSVCVQGSSSLEIDGTAIGSSFTILAVGDPEGLLAALQRPGGIISLLQLYVNATIDAQQSTALTIPATHHSLQPRVALTVP